MTQHKHIMRYAYHRAQFVRYPLICSQAKHLTFYFVSLLIVIIIHVLFPMAVD